MSEAIKKLIGAALLIATVGASSCIAMLEARAAGAATPTVSEWSR